MPTRRKVLTGLAALAGCSQAPSPAPTPSPTKVEPPQMPWTQPYLGQPPPPQVPTGLMATVISSSEIDLSWNASSDPGGPGLKDYGVYRYGALVAYVTGLSYNDTGLSASTLYTYQVTARDIALRESGPSAPVSATTNSSGASGFIPNASLAVSYSGNFADGQTMTVNLLGGGLGARANALPLYYWPMEQNFSTHPTLSRTSATLTPLNSNCVIQSSVTPVNAAGACQYLPAPGNSTHTAFSDSPNATISLPAGAQVYSVIKRNWNFVSRPGNIKSFRVWTAPGTSFPNVFLLNYDISFNEFACAGDPQTLTSGISSKFTPQPLGLGTWWTDEYWLQGNTYATYDGIINCVRQGVISYEMAGRWNLYNATNGAGPCADLFFDETSAVHNNITNITNTVNAIFTISSSSLGAPKNGDAMTVSGIAGGSMTQMNGLTATVTAVSGTGPWTVTTNVDTSNTSNFSPYVGGSGGIVVPPPNGVTDYAYYGLIYLDDSFLQLIVTDEGTSYDTTGIRNGGLRHNREIQLQTSRTDTSITFTVRKGSLSSLTGKNLLAITGYGTSINLGVGA